LGSSPFVDGQDLAGRYVPQRLPNSARPADLDRRNLSPGAQPEMRALEDMKPTLTAAWLHNALRASSQQSALSFHLLSASSRRREWSRIVAARKDSDV